MKRLSAHHRKIAARKEEVPNFYQLARVSPLSGANARGGSGGRQGWSTSEAQSGRPAALVAVNPLLPDGAAVPGEPMTSMGSLLRGPLDLPGYYMDSFLSSLTGSTGSQPLPLPSLAQLQRENEDLKRRHLQNENDHLRRLERENEELRGQQLERENDDLRRRILAIENQQLQGGHQHSLVAPRSMALDLFPTVTTSLTATSSPGEDGENAAAARDGSQKHLQLKVERMRRDFMHRHGAPPAGDPLAANAATGVPRHPPPPALHASETGTAPAGFPGDL